MSAIANIAIQDGKSKPDTHTFIPIKSGLESQWRENQPGLPLVGQAVISSVLKLNPQNGLNRVKLVLELPALETAAAANSQGYTAAPKVAYSNRVTIEMVLPSRGTDVQRRDLRVLAQNLLADPVVIDLIENLSTPY